MGALLMSVNIFAEWDGEHQTETEMIIVQKTS